VIASLKENGVQGPVEVSIALVGDRKMRELSQKYKGEDKTRNILSFSLAEGEPTVLPTDILRLGDIVISYPEVIREAVRDEVLVDDRVNELVEHGLLHLLGLHHE
jgi:probable rRNA maturation factor